MTAGTGFVTVTDDTLDGGALTYPLAVANGGTHQSALGTAHQVLSVNGDATDTEWVTPLLLPGTGSDSACLGSGCTSTGENSICIGAVSTADGGGSISLGYNNSNNKLFGQAYGAYNSNWGSSSICMGESNSIGTDSIFPEKANTIGHANTVNADFSVAIGSYCLIDSATATRSVALGYGAYAMLPGQLAHSSGISHFQGGNSIDLACQLTSNTGDMQMADGNPFLLQTYTFVSMRARIMAAKTSGASKVACEVHELVINVQSGSTTIVSDTTVSGSGSLAANGWGVTIYVASSTELRFVCDSGADTVRFAARVEWSEITGL